MRRQAPTDGESQVLSIECERDQWAKRVATYECALAPHLIKEQKLAEAKARKTEQKRAIAELRATVASVNGKTRKMGARVKAKLSKQIHCAYCGGGLGSAAHADHIYPVCKGGRSVERNMVLVCAGCNTRKGTLTLAAFIKTYHLSRQDIEKRLTDLGKEF